MFRFQIHFKNKYKSKLEYNFSIIFLIQKSYMIKLQHKKIGDYIMLTNKKVAQLKHSIVYMGLNTKNKKKVLIKTISRSQYQSNDVLMNSFNFQYNTMNLLKEQNILKAIQLIVTEKNLYLILEEPQGESIKKSINKNGALKEKQLRNYLRKLKSTFSTLQSNKIIHGNINSKSVLIHHNQIKLGYPSYVKTIEVLKTNSMHNSEFSLGQDLEKQKDYSYLPPELLSHGIVSLKHDIWSFGVVIYETLFGSLPWNLLSCNTPSEMASFINNQKIYFPKDRNISKQMKHFLVNCLQMDPVKRFGWEQALEHPVFNTDVEIFQFQNTDEQEGCQEQTQVNGWPDIKKEAISNSTITQ